MRIRPSWLGLALMGLAACAALAGCGTPAQRTGPLVRTTVRNVGDQPVFLRRAELARGDHRPDPASITFFRQNYFYCDERWVEVRRLAPAQEVICDGVDMQTFYLAADAQYPSPGAISFQLLKDHTSIEARSDGRDVHLVQPLPSNTLWHFNSTMLHAAKPPTRKSHVYDPPRPWYLGDAETGEQ